MPTFAEQEPTQRQLGLRLRERGAECGQRVDSRVQVGLEARRLTPQLGCQRLETRQLGSDVGRDQPGRAGEHEGEHLLGRSRVSRGNGLLDRLHPEVDEVVFQPDRLEGMAGGRQAQLAAPLRVVGSGFERHCKQRPGPDHPLLAGGHGGDPGWQRLRRFSARGREPGSDGEQARRRPQLLLACVRSSQQFAQLPPTARGPQRDGQVHRRPLRLHLITRLFGQPKTLLGGVDRRPDVARALKGAHVLQSPHQRPLQLVSAGHHDGLLQHGLTGRWRARTKPDDRPGHESSGQPFVIIDGLTQEQHSLAVAPGIDHVADIEGRPAQDLEQVEEHQLGARLPVQRPVHRIEQRQRRGHLPLPHQGVPLDGGSPGCRQVSTSRQMCRHGFGGKVVGEASLSGEQRSPGSALQQIRSAVVVAR